MPGAPAQQLFDDLVQLRIGIPALAWLSILHGLVPPHPGPLAAVDALHVDMGITLARSSRNRLSDVVGSSLPAIAGIILIVGAGGGFKQTLVDPGVNNMITDVASGANLSPWCWAG